MLYRITFNKSTLRELHTQCLNSFRVAYFMCMQDSIDVFQTHVLSVIRVTPKTNEGINPPQLINEFDGIIRLLRKIYILAKYNIMYMTPSVCYDGHLGS